MREEAEPRVERMTIKFNKSELEEIKKMAEELNIPKGTYARNLVMTGVEDTKILKKIGVLGLMKGIANTRNFIKKFTMTKEIASINK